MQAQIQAPNVEEIRFGDDETRPRKRVLITGKRRMPALRKHFESLRDVPVLSNPVDMEDFLLEFNKENCDPASLSPLERIELHNLIFGLGVPASPAVQPAAVVDPTKWRSQMRTVDQLEDGDVRMIIKGFLPEGTIFFGGLSGKGKTWVVLSVVKALTTGRPFVGTFGVPEQIPVLYLIPESSGRAFKARLKKLGIPSDEKRFLCRTLSEGPTLMLNDPYIRQCVKDIKPIVVLDTAIRFSTAQDENAAMQNKALSDSIVALRQAGAVAVIGIHHSTKASAGEKPTLENTLRGTGDLGAMCDAVYHVDQDELDGTVTMRITCVKPRDFEPPFPFQLVAKTKENGVIVSRIDLAGDFEMVEYGTEAADKRTALAQAINDNPTVTVLDLAARCKIDKNLIAEMAKDLGWKKVTKRAPWTRIKADSQKAEPAKLSPGGAKVKPASQETPQPELPLTGEENF